MGNVFWKSNKEKLEEDRQDGLQREREREKKKNNRRRKRRQLLLPLSQPNTDILGAPGGECRGE